MDLHNGWRCAACIQAEATLAEQKAYEAHEAALSRISQIADPIERLLTFFGYVKGAAIYGLGLRTRSGSTGVTEDAVPSKVERVTADYRKICANQASPRDEVRAAGHTWDSAAVVRWFCERARLRGLEPPVGLTVMRPKRGFLTGRYLEPVARSRCWRFADGGTFGTPGGPGRGRHFEVYVTDRAALVGIVEYGPWLDDRNPPVERYCTEVFDRGPDDEPLRLNSRALAEMARILNLTGE
ncbi:hypothetical protein [Catellatospora sp. NPDC049609]|uniref:hypothetical protein n=1 Tax=Catellatospora sp. NPDC049609 TaxID=3155505 RepID=UPI003445DCA5